MLYVIKQKRDEALVSSSNANLYQQQPGILAEMCSCLCKSNLDVNWSSKENLNQHIQTIKAAHFKGI